MEKPILFSDLDQTLIYSPRQINKYDDQFENKVIMEMYEGKPLSYMTFTALTKLVRISEELNFVPVTTRTLEQFKRVKLTPSVTVDYGITTNGAKIVDFEGNEDISWTNKTMSLIESNSAHPDKVQEELLKLLAEASDEVKNWVKLIRPADGFFSYIVTYPDVEQPAEFVKLLETKAAEWNYAMSFQSSKIYFVPRDLTKQRAAQEVFERLEGTTSFAAGDSFLDVGLMQFATDAIRPNHGELNHLEAAKGFSVTNIQGIKAAEEILEYVLKKVDN